MKKDNLNTVFENLEGQFDLEVPNNGHQNRFLEKLNNQQGVVKLTETKSKSVISLWKPFIGIAASIALIISVFAGVQGELDSKDLASISPEMAETQDFFTTAIATELEKLNSEESPEYQELIVDTMFQIKLLEENYEQLKIDLNDSGDDKRVIFAMISNFQDRIDLLQNVIEQIDNLKNDKNEQNENSSTI